jgi:formylglycine-generating enzyme required for sulfatase activity
VDAAAAWSGAIDAVAHSPHYGGLHLVPQLGLVPLGPDPASGLWEFAHLASGTPAVRSVNGELVLEDANGVVLVLVPAGEFAFGSVLPTRTLGATADGDIATETTNVDLLARADEGPVVRIALSAFFVSKYELTWAQWRRLGGSAPRATRAGDATKLLPVNTIAWEEARDALAHVALVLPTEAQWEYSARAATTTRFWCGREASSLIGRVNAGWGSDGLALHEGDQPAPVAVQRLPPNPWGLHHVAGNVAEWIDDAYASDTRGPRRTGDGGRITGDTFVRLVRGGAFDSSPRDLRSAARRPVPAGSRGADIGVRPARRLDP